jgi:UDP-N-acetyl-D-mannosaminuronic acid dehydrogenase
MNGSIKYEVCIIGGAGHVGLPLGVVFADAGVKTVLLDINTEALKKIEKGQFPFMEKGGEDVLRSALVKKTLFIADSPKAISDSKYVIIVTGTPVDQYLRPDFKCVTRVIDEYLPYFRDGHIVILRSTVYPGTTDVIQKYFLEKGKRVKLCFCPERVTQGRAIEEIKQLPQLISAVDEDTIVEVSTLFWKITSAEIIPLKPIEAELAKLFTNFWRYARFAVANQYFMIASHHGLNYVKIYRAMKKDYPRNADLPSPGFASGPCLFKDAMQLAAFASNNFAVGHAAMAVNEGFGNYIISSLKGEFGPALKDKTLGILGMAFKAGVDDPRGSLSYKLKEIAQHECRAVLCTDPYVEDSSLVPVEKLLHGSDIVILTVAHEPYAEINPALYPNKKFIDVWGFWQTS